MKSVARLSLTWLQKFDTLNLFTKQTVIPLHKAAMDVIAPVP